MGRSLKRRPRLYTEKDYWRAYEQIDRNRTPRDEYSTAMPFQTTIKSTILRYVLPDLLGMERYDKPSQYYSALGICINTRLNFEPFEMAEDTPKCTISV